MSVQSWYNASAGRCWWVVEWWWSLTSSCDMPALAGVPVLLFFCSSAKWSKSTAAGDLNWSVFLRESKLTAISECVLCTAGLKWDFCYWFQEYQNLNSELKSFKRSKKCLAVIFIRSWKWQMSSPFLFDVRKWNPFWSSFPSCVSSSTSFCTLCRNSVMFLGSFNKDYFMDSYKTV